MVNSIAELAGRERAPGRQGASYLERLHGAFTSSLLAAAARAEAEEAAIAQRAHLLTAYTLGIWLSARIDTARAACSATRSFPMSGPGGDRALGSRIASKRPSLSAI
jgi:hypothetical protein